MRQFHRTLRAAGAGGEQNGRGFSRIPLPFHLFQKCGRGFNLFRSIRQRHQFGLGVILHPPPVDVENSLHASLPAFQ